jgi:hypothetical protein
LYILTFMFLDSRREDKRHFSYKFSKITLSYNAIAILHTSVLLYMH